MNQYNPDEHRAAHLLAAYTVLGSEINALHGDLRAQRERADDYMRANAELCSELDTAQTDAAKLRIYVAHLEGALTNDQIATAAAAATAQWNREHGL